MWIMELLANCFITTQLGYVYAANLKDAKMKFKAGLAIMN